MNKNILILGSDGMLGRTIFLYLDSLFPENIWGTTRKKKNQTKKIFFFNAETYQKDFLLIKKNLKKLDYIINCIGILKKDYDKQELVYVNALFPHLLEKLAEKNNFKLIHISTDAVFSPLSEKVSESSPVGPIDNYGSSKLLGETTSKNALTFRSSFIGLDPINHKGLLEWTLKTPALNGYTNQLWSGCTTIQFAKFCENIIRNNLFLKLRRQSPIYHFAPLKTLSKYQLIKTFAKLSKKDFAITKATGEKVIRTLMTNYFDSLSMNEYTSSTKEAIRELLLFESNIQGKK